MPWPEELKPTVGINGDRRADRRYCLELELRWKLVRRRKVLDTGTGHTVDLSSGGLLFDAKRHLPAGLNVELSVSWPALLHNVAPMQLVISGRIVRAQGTRIAVRTMQHEFRTMGLASDGRNAASTETRTPTVLLVDTVAANEDRLH
jgi:hypothetical protein